jgi:serine phosphatase RsbU (regulator of sigma subunit)
VRGQGPVFGRCILGRESEGRHLRLSLSGSDSGRPRVGRTRPWVTAWLFAAALLAILLLANSVRDYLVVWRILATQQVRHRMAQYVAALEQELRRSPTPTVTLGELPKVEPDRSLPDALWLEIRRPDGSVLARRGNLGGRMFTAEEESSFFRRHEPLYKIAPLSAGEAVVEVFPLYGARLAPSGGSAEAEGAPPGRGTRSVLSVEIAAPLVIREPSILWPIRQNLVINCAAGLALLATVILAALAFRSYERRRWLETQLDIAREVQGALLPSLTDEHGPVRVAALYRPAEQVGGDFYDVFRAEEAKVALVIGDVAGKGVPSALLAGLIHGAVRSAAWTESRERHERESERLNELLCGDAPGRRYASMFWCYYEPSRSILHYLNAGHFPPILVSPGDGPAGLALLDTGGPVLGALSDAHYTQGRREVRPGDTLVLYSDGLIEAANPSGEEYGMERLRERLRACSGDADPYQVRDAILTSVGEFLGVAAPRDDLTLVVAGFGSPVQPTAPSPGRTRR